MLMNRLILLFLALCLSLVMTAQDIREEFENVLIEKSAGIETISCRFTQVRTMSVLANDVRKEGHFTCVRPGNILLAFEDGDYIKLTDTHFKMKNAGAVTDMKISTNPMLKELKRILSACMTGDVRMLSSGFEIDVEDAGSFYEVSLLPLRNRGAAQMKSVILHFEKQDMSLDLLLFEEASGDSITYEFTEKEFNVSVDEELFR